MAKRRNSTAFQRLLKRPEKGIKNLKPSLILIPICPKHFEGTPKGFEKEDYFF
jgi:hypothetical protein